MEICAPSRGLCGLFHVDNDSKCRSCDNILLYRSRCSHEGVSICKEVSDPEVPLTFPGPGKILKSPIYGNYVVASRRIEEGEIICKEQPLLMSPYGPSDLIPFCFSCYKDMAYGSRCSKCRWPVCSKDCEESFAHCENECEILARNHVKPKGALSEYFSIEVLRALLCREKDPKKWNRVMQFESHENARKEDVKAQKSTREIIDFIQNKCNLGETQYNSDLISKLVGIMSVNTFWTYNYTNRYATALFDRITLFAHDCDPNTVRDMYFLDDQPNDNNKQCDEVRPPGTWGLVQQVKAKRTIEPGEMITIHYVNPEQSVHLRRKEIKQLFYFDCYCDRCLAELTKSHLDNASNNNNNDDFPSVQVDLVNMLMSQATL